MDWITVFSSVAIGVLIFVALLSRRGSSLDSAVYQQKWEKVQEYYADDTKLGEALIEADKLLDRALKESKFKGGTTGERLVSAKKVFSKRDHVWMAHKMRNRVVHETGFQPDRKQTRAALTAFHRALREIGAL